jgi:hypothetical protein
MSAWKICGLLSAILCLVALGRTAADAPAKGDAGVLVVIDNAGKEHKLKKWEFLDGVEPLPWAAAGKAAAKAGTPATTGGKNAPQPPAASGPMVLRLREENSTQFRDGILTMVPLDRISKIEYDQETKTVTVTVKADKGEETLSGSTRFVGVNKLSLEAEVDLGDLGTASVKFQGGTPTGVKSIRFPAPKAGPAPTGPPAEITAADQEKTVHKVVDPQPMYRLTGVEYRLLPTLLFQKTVRIDVDKLQALRRVENEEVKGGKEYEVTLKDGKQLTLTLRDNVSPLDGKLARLEGFVTRVPAGYKLFPVYTISALEFEGKKGE